MVVAAVSGAYNVGYNQGSKDLESYEESGKFKLPETLAALNQVSELVRDQLSDITKLEQLETDVVSLREENLVLSKEKEKLERTNEQLKIKHDILQQQLKEILSPVEDFTLRQGETKKLIPNFATLGLYYKYSNFVTVTLFNETNDMNIGDTLKFDFSNTNCRLELLLIADEFTKFSFGCP